MEAQPVQERQENTRRVAAAKTKSSDVVAVSDTPSVSVCDDLQVLIAKRAHQLYEMRGWRDGHALDDWLQAEREMLSQVQPV